MPASAKTQRRGKPSDSAGDTRERLLLTALHLYATEGLHAVSLRRIAVEAGSKNSAAMHYHFDNQRGVVKRQFRGHLVNGVRRHRP